MGEVLLVSLMEVLSLPLQFIDFHFQLNILGHKLVHSLRHRLDDVNGLFFELVELLEAVLF